MYAWHSVRHAGFQLTSLRVFRISDPIPKPVERMKLVRGVWYTPKALEKTQMLLPLYSFIT